MGRRRTIRILGKRITQYRENQYMQKYHRFLKAFDEVCEASDGEFWNARPEIPLIELPLENISYEVVETETTSEQNQSEQIS